MFGYGSLMWRPGFAFEQAAKARLVGFRRAFCIYSTHHRGTELRPGLVLGLDRGGTCQGVAYRVAGRHRHETIAYLRAREQISGVYRETEVPLQLAHDRGPEVPAVAYVVERAHPSYAHRLPFLRQVGIIRGAKGLSGPNIEYLVNTAEHLRELDIRDRNLERLASAMGGLFTSSYADAATLYRRSLAAATTRRDVVRTAPKLRPAERRRFGHRMLMR